MQSHINLIIRGVIGFLLSMLSATASNAQTMSHPDSVSPLKPNAYLKHQDPWRWDIKSQVFLRAGYYTIENGQYREQRSGNFNIQSFEYIFPVVREGGYYWTPNESVEISYRIDDAIYKIDHKIMQTPESHAQYVWWSSNKQDSRTHQLHLSQVSHIVCADTVFDEKKAKQLPWPDEWSEETERFLTPIVDPVGEPIDLSGQDQLTLLVNQWMEGNDPRSIDQVTLAKFLTGKVIEHVRIVRGSLFQSRQILLNDQSYYTSRYRGLPSSNWSGFYVRSADQIALDSRGTELDLSSMLTAVLRTAGVPARTVVCYDNSPATVIEERIRGIVEFAMYDPVSDQTLWIPIDPKELKDNGRRSRYYKQRWDYFGTHDYLRNLVPLAYYFHPPVNYQAYGFPALYGFRAEPDIGNAMMQWLSVDVVNSPLRGDEVRHP